MQSWSQFPANLTPLILDRLAPCMTRAVHCPAADVVPDSPLKCLIQHVRSRKARKAGKGQRSLIILDGWVSRAAHRLHHSGTASRVSIPEQIQTRKNSVFPNSEVASPTTLSAVGASQAPQTRCHGRRTLEVPNRKDPQSCAGRINVLHVSTSPLSQPRKVISIAQLFPLKGWTAQSPA